MLNTGVCKLNFTSFPAADISKYSLGVVCNYCVLFTYCVKRFETVRIKYEEIFLLSVVWITFGVANGRAIVLICHFVKKKKLRTCV